MRVVWMTHNYPRFAGDIAGAFLHPLAIALRHRNIDVRVIAPSDAGRSGHDELDGVPINRVRYGAPEAECLAYRGTMAAALRSPAGWLAFNRLCRALRTGASTELQLERGPVLVHAHWWIPAGLAAPHSAPLVVSCHGTDVRLLDRVPFAAMIGRRVLRRARVVTAVSNSVAEVIRRRTGVAIAEDAIQPMPVLETDRPWSDATGGLVVIGRLTRQKRVHLALDAVAAARQRGMTLPLKIVGDGPERRELEHHAAGLGLGDTVRFVGEVIPSRVPAILSTAACFLMPAQREGFGLAAAEAIMQGVPVIVCEDGGGLRDVIPANGAGRVAAPDGSAIAAALIDLLGDGTARTAARAEGERWRARLSPDAVADRCVQWYDRALSA